MRYKVVIRFAIDGDLRFISHLDTMRLFERALSRSALPVRFSEGFNPRPKLSLPVPRTVGIASQGDILRVEFTRQVDPPEIVERLGRQMPDGAAVLEARAVGTSAWPVIDRVTYTLALQGARPVDLADAVKRLLAADTWPVRRSSPADGRGRTIDLRAFLIHADVNAERLRWTARLTNEGTARPAELLAAVGLEPEAWLHRVRREAIELNSADDADARTGGSRPSGD